jgi:hypothetical protein
VSARAAALATLRRCADALRSEPATPAERERILSLHATALAVLEGVEARRSSGTSAKLERLRTLERQLAHLDPGQRAAAIRERLGLGRSRYYELRAIVLSPGNEPDSRAV